MDGREIAGILLILAGVAWFFLAGWGPPLRGEQAASKNPISELIDALREWVARLPAKYVPGVVLIAFGVLLLLWGPITQDAEGEAFSPPNAHSLAQPWSR
jgi:drug/metabolite transporter (DMT)-like permease